MSSHRSTAFLVSAATMLVVSALIFQFAGREGKSLEPVAQTGHVWPLSFLAFANGGEHLVTESVWGIIIWDAETGEQLQNIKTLAGGCQLSPDARTLLFVSNDSEFGTLCLQEVGQPQPRLRIDLPNGCDPRAMRFSHNGRYVLTRDLFRPLLHVWNARTGQPVSTPEVPTYDSLQVVELQKQFAGRRRGEIPEDDEGVLQMLLALQTAGPNRSPLTTAGAAPLGFGDGYFSPDGKLFVSVNWHDTGSSFEDVAVWNSSTGKLLHFFQGRYNSPQHVLFHPDRKQYLIGVGLRSAELHSAVTGETIRTLGEFSDEITSLSICQSGQWIIAGTSAGDLAVWEANTGERLANLLLKTPVNSIACYRNRQIVVASDSTHVYSLPGLDSVREIPRPADKVLLSPDGQRMLLSHFPSVSSQYGSVSLYDVAAGTKIKSIMRSPDTRILLSPNGKSALGIPRREQFNERFPSVEIPLWRVDTGERIHTFPPGSDEFDFHFPPSVATRRDITSTPPISSAGVGTIRPRHSSLPPDFRFNLKAWDSVHTMPDLDGSTRSWLMSLGFQRPSLPTLDGPQLMYKAPSGQLRTTVWNTGPGGRIVAHYKSGVLSHVYTIPEMTPTAATLNGEGTQLIVGYRAPEWSQSARAIAVFSTTDGKLLQRIDATQKDMEASWDIDTLALSPDDRFLAVGYSYHNYILDWKTKEFALVGMSNGGLPAREVVIFSPDSKRAILFGRRRTLWDLTAKKALLDLGAYNDAHGMTFSPNGQTLYINGNDGPRLINASTGKVIHQFDRQHIEVRFSPDGTRVIPLQHDLNVISLWDFQTATPVCQLTEGSSRHLTNALFTPDGSRVVSMETSAGVSTLTVRNAENGEVLGKHTRKSSPFGYRVNHQAPVFASHDRLITVQTDGVTVWDLETAQPLHHFSAAGKCHCSMVHHDGTVLVIAPGTRATLWNIKTGARLRDFKPMPEDLSFPNPVWFSEDGKQLFVRHRKGQSVTLWDTATGELIARHHLIDEGQTWSTEATKSR